MTEKLKRKNDVPIPRRYWWIFGILALVLLIPWRTPERMDLTLWGYVFVWLLVGMIATKYVGTHGQRHLVSLLVLACLILPFAQSVFIVRHEPAFMFVRSDDVCEREQYGLLQVKTCTYGHCTVTYPARYITLMDLPVYILIEPIRDDNFQDDCFGSG